MCFTLSSRQQQEQSCQDKHIKRMIEHMMSARLLTLNTHTHTYANTKKEQMPKELLLWEDCHLFFFGIMFKLVKLELF